MFRLLRMHIFWGTLTGHSVGEFLHPHALQIYQNVGNNLLFQQDNASTHTFNMARSCLHASHINTLGWPSRSSDLPQVILGRLQYPFPLPHYPYWNAGCLNNGKAVHRLFSISMRNKIKECINKGSGHHTRY